MLLFLSTTWVLNLLILAPASLLKDIIVLDRHVVAVLDRLVQRSAVAEVVAEVVSTPATGGTPATDGNTPVLYSTLLQIANTPLQNSGSSCYSTLLHSNIPPE